MKSVGEDAGEFSDIQMPVMEDFETTRNYKLKWEKIAEGPDYTSFKFRQKVKYAIIEEEVIIYNRVKKIDFNIAILNWEGVMFREFRAAFPVNMKNNMVSYEVPFGVVKVGHDEIEGAAGERYKTICSTIHPRGIENWIAASDKEISVILSSTCGVADYIDPTSNPVKQTILQPILLASRRSCNGEGNEYPQKGNHYYHFSLTSKSAEEGMDFSFGREANEELFTIVSPKRLKSANLPEELSFFSTGAENLSISTVKKAEDENGLIIRAYETKGVDTKFSLKSYFNLSGYIKTNIIEYPLENKSDKMGKEYKKSYPLDIGKFAIETFLFKL
jgi:alpha-mannosidase